MIITPAADLGLASASLVRSAFGNSGQKCSAASLGICVGDVYTSERFLKSLKEAVESIKVGTQTDISTVMGPVIIPPDERLYRALTTLEDGETWLVEPQCLDKEGEGRLWTPGVRLNVKPGSWFHRTEVFGPVLGLMHANNLDEALEFQNGTAFGLTAGLQSLDSKEIDHWKDRVQAGNLYINRGITGAIVQRQSFGGWKESVVGPGAKAGGPNYLSQLGIVHDEHGPNRDSKWLALAVESDEQQWDNYFSKEQDPTGLFCESNNFRYRPLTGIAVRVALDANKFEVERVRLAIDRCGVPVAAWSDAKEEDESSFADRVKTLGVERIRMIGQPEEHVVNAVAQTNIHLTTAPVVANGRYELLHYLREQAVCQTLHRHGKLM